MHAMSIKPLILLPDPVLRRQSDPIERVDDAVLALADDMLETMYDAPGIGLAAVQVGIPRRLLVVDCSREDEDQAPMVFINPQVVASSDERSTYEEGCLSIPDYYAEIDHLNGILFIDHISKLKRDMVVKKFTKLAKGRSSAAL